MSSFRGIRCRPPTKRTRRDARPTAKRLRRRCGETAKRTRRDPPAGERRRSKVTPESSLAAVRGWRRTPARRNLGSIRVPRSGRAPRHVHGRRADPLPLLPVQQAPGRLEIQGGRGRGVPSVLGRVGRARSRGNRLADAFPRSHADRDAEVVAVVEPDRARGRVVGRDPRWKWLGIKQ